MLPFVSNSAAWLLTLGYARLFQLATAFGLLQDKVWEKRGLTLQTKLKVVLPSLLYARETWTVCSCHAKQLYAFHMKCLRSLLHVKWRDKVPDTMVLQMTKVERSTLVIFWHE